MKSSRVRRLLDGFEDVVVLGRLSRRYRGNLVTELFVVELPEDTEMLKEEEEKKDEKKGERLLQGTLFVSETSNQSSRDASRDRADVKVRSIFGLGRIRRMDTICILLRDDKNSFQLHLVDSTTGTIEQLSSLKEKGSQLGLLVVAGRFVYLFRDGKNRIARRFERREEKPDGIFDSSDAHHRRRRDSLSECVCISPNEEARVFRQNRRQRRRQPNSCLGAAAAACALPE